MPRRKREEIEDRATTQMVYNRTALGGHEDAFDKLTMGMATLAEVLPARITLRQVVALSAVIEANARGKRIKLADIKRRYPVVGKHLNKSYQKLLPKSPRDPEAMGLLMQQANPQDAREKFLVLTHEGINVAHALMDTLSPPPEPI